MQHGQNVDLFFRRNRIDDPVRQSRHHEHPRSSNITDMTKFRELPEHHRNLDNSADHSFSGALIVLRNPIADCDQIVPRFWCEVNPQA